MRSGHGEAFGNRKFGTVVVVGGGVGAAMAYPTAAELKLAGNDDTQRRRREGNELKLVKGLRAAGNRIPGAVCRG